MLNVVTLGLKIESRHPENYGNRFIKTFYGVNFKGQFCKNQQIFIQTVPINPGNIIDEPNRKASIEHAENYPVCAKPDMIQRDGFNGSPVCTHLTEFRHIVP